MRRLQASKLVGPLSVVCWVSGCFPVVLTVGSLASRLVSLGGVFDDCWRRSCFSRHPRSRVCCRSAGGRVRLVDMAPTGRRLIRATELSVAGCVLGGMLL